MKNKIPNLLGALNMLEKHEHKCYVLTLDEFERLCEVIYGHETEVIFDNNGITIETNNEQDDMFENDELAKELSKQLMLNIVSVHITDVDDNVYIIIK